MKTRIYIVRHGESEGNIKGDITGADPALTARGIAQAKELATFLSDLTIDIIYSSPLIRAYATALEIAKKRGLPIIVSHSIKERYFGSLEGKKRAEVQKKYKEKYEAFDTVSEKEQLLWKVVEDMESFTDVYGRVVSFFDEVTTLYPGKSVLLVSHAHVMLSLLVKLGFATFRELPFGSIKNTGYITIEKENKSYRIVSVFGITKTASS